MGEGRGMKTLDLSTKQFSIIYRWEKLVHGWRGELPFGEPPYDVEYLLNAYIGDKVQQVIKRLDSRSEYIDKFPWATIRHLTDPTPYQGRPFLVTARHMEEESTYGYTQSFETLQEAVDFCECYLGLKEEQ
jgi:hypothetical protein